MATRKKNFEACVLRIQDDELLVAKWNQLVTTAEKSKISVGAYVGFRRSTNKREEVIRGKILIIGKLLHP